MNEKLLEELLEGLNEEQKRVVLSNGKPILVVAGAGSGKTKTIIHKALYLIFHEESLVRARRLLMITFTNKAANEIKERIQKYANLLGKNINIEWIGTFHSVASRIIRKHHAIFGLSNDFRVLDEEDSTRLFKSIIKDQDVKKEEAKKLFIAVNQAIEGIRFLDEDNKFDRKVLELKDIFLNAMVETNAVTFSYLMGAFKDMLQKDEAFRNYYQNFFDYIIVDEFQDTNTTQYDIIKHISKKDNICVIGDPNQCIYEWRMAHPDNIISFIEDYNPEVIKLNINYRSSNEILLLANDVLKNSKAKWKELVPILKSHKKESKTYPKPVIIFHPNEEKEAEWIAKKIEELSKSVPLEEIAILVRVSYITNFLEQALVKAKIPHKIVGALRFFQRKEIKDILAYLHLAINPKDSVSFQRAITNPKRGIGEKTIEKIVNLSKQKSIDLIQATKYVLGNKLFEENSFINAMERLIHNLEKGQANNGNISFYVEKLIKDIKYFEYLEQEYKEDCQERIDNVKELLRFFEIEAQKYQENQKERLKELLQELSLMEEDEKDNSKAVKIMTIHKAKGLEFEAVFMPRLENGILPHSSAFDDVLDMEEERRLLYVGITRAKRYLFLSYTATGKISDFINIMDKTLLDTSLLPPETLKDQKAKTVIQYEPISYKSSKNKASKKIDVKVGDIVFHEVFGEGQVLNISNGVANVRFKDKDRTIVKEFLKPL
ncbi:MAG: DNA helicase UvrD [Hydrogenobaculum sp.]|nr:MAG: DNA helicase UvrD [Hydrogenobaculum sp.]